MLLAIDIGNTSIAFGIFAGKQPIKHWRLATKGASAKTLRQTLSRNTPPHPHPLPRLRQGYGGQARGERGRFIDGACISSVVPRLNPILRKVIRKRFGCRTLFVTAKNAGIKIPRYNKKQIGADRLVNAAAVYKKYKRPCIVIDFGTATTFDYVTRKGEYGGGVIAPGIGIINDALSNMTAKLPIVPIRKTKQIIAQNTKQSMQSGVFHGYVGLVDHVVSEIKKEVKTNPKVVATGGFAHFIASSIKTIEKVEPYLTLEGLKIIWEKRSASFPSFVRRGKGR